MNPSTSKVYSSAHFRVRLALLSALIAGSIQIAESRAEDLGSSPPDASAPDAAAAGDSASDDPLNLPPDEFFNLDLSVYSPAKKLQKLKNTPSAIYVMTNEDIRRSGATTLLEVFRLVPGIEVAQVSAHEFAISARGFNQVFGNKILLLIDGAAVETPIFNGILWENINIPLDVVDRVEFVRGPGASVWGTRAMNGLINVITKDAFTFPHNKASIGGGSEHQVSAYARTGAVLSETTAVQTYVKVDKYDGSVDTSGNSLDDDWDIFTGNVRADLKPTDKDKVRLLGTLSNRRADFELNVPTLSDPFTEERHDTRENNRGSFGALWEHDLGEGSDFSLEWTNLAERRVDLLLGYTSYYSDLEARHHVHFSETNDLSYGMNVRFYTDRTEGSQTLHFDDNDRSLQYYRAFVQDDIALIDKVVTLTLGSRFEQNDQVGFGVLPTARILWSPTERVSFWAAASYTEGSPSRVYDDVRLQAASFQEPETGLPAVVQVTGNRGVNSEKLMAYEVGSWAEPVEKLYASLTGYYFRYDDIVNNQFGEAVPILDDPNNPYLLVPYNYANELEANSVGGELSLDWNVTDWFDFVTTYSYIHTTVGPSVSENKDFVKDNPQHYGTVQGHFSVDKYELDTIFRYVDRLAQSEIPSYFEGDLRVGWNIQPDLDIELIGRNLLHDRHQEFGSVVFQTPLSEVQRSVFMRLNFTF